MRHGIVHPFQRIRPRRGRRGGFGGCRVLGRLLAMRLLFLHTDIINRDADRPLALFVNVLERRLRNLEGRRAIRIIGDTRRFHCRRREADGDLRRGRHDRVPPPPGI